jgi:hypothetical protein
MALMTFVVMAIPSCADDVGKSLGHIFGGG